MASSKRGRPRHDDVLTPAEWRTVHAVQHGMSSREIARRRGISIDAVKFHVGNALGKLRLTNRQVLRHWFLAPRDSALGRQEHTMDEHLKLGAIAQISRSVSDIEQAKAWYGDVLGLQHLYSFGELAFFDSGGTRLFLSQAKGEPGSESILYFQVADITAVHQQLLARGVAFISAPHRVHRHDDGTEEWMAFFQDPDGRPLAIASQVRG